MKHTLVTYRPPKSAHKRWASRTSWGLRLTTCWFRLLWTLPQAVLTSMMTLQSQRSRPQKQSSHMTMSMCNSPRRRLQACPQHWRQPTRPTRFRPHRSLTRPPAERSTRSLPICVDQKWLLLIMGGKTVRPQETTRMMSPRRLRRQRFDAARRRALRSLRRRTSIAHKRHHVPLFPLR